MTEPVSCCRAFGGYFQRCDLHVGTDHKTSSFAVDTSPRLVEQHRPGRLPGRDPAAGHR